ncbi:hypothetical protein [Fodinicola acaciae]|uniref:hypothetical protein n=1 Tax=Fodinicola acaciae TaxID=2681555 RepID=UPI0013D143BB|nr:hypothetical protein [Fodinicola acaciae]
MSTHTHTRRTVTIAVGAVLAAAALGVGAAYGATTYLHGSQPSPAGDTAAGQRPAAQQQPQAAGQNVPQSSTSDQDNSPAIHPVSASKSIPTTPVAYAKEAFEAWRTQQTTRLHQLTDATGYQQFEAVPRQSTGRVWYFATCDGGAGQIYCTFAAHPTGDTVVVHMPNGPVKEHQIIGVAYQKGHAKAPARNIPAYSQAAATAFSNQDYDLLAHVTTASAFKSLLAQPAPGAQSWSAPSCEGAAGSTYCTLTSKQGAKVVFRSDNGVPGGHFPLVDLQSYTKPTH